MSLIDSFWTKTNEVANSVISKLPTSQSLFGQTSVVTTSSGSSGGSTDPSLANRKYTVRIYQNSTVIVGAVPNELEINQSASWSAPWASGVGGTKGDILALGLGTRLVAQVLTLQVWQGGGANDFDFNIQFQFRAFSDPERDVMIPLRTLLEMSMPSLNANGFLQAPGPVLTQEGIKKLGAGAGAVLVKTGQLAIQGAKAAASMAGNVVSGGATTDGQLGSIQEAGTNAVNEIGTVAKANGLTRKGIESNMKNKIRIEVGDWFRLSNVLITDVRHTLLAQRPGPEGTLMAADVVVSFRPMFTLTAEDVGTFLGLQNTVRG